MRWIPASLMATAILATPGFAAAQNYPERPIRFIIQSPAGGTGDLIGRVVAKHLSETLGQPVVADNRGGASGTLSANITAKAAPDGYTLLAVGPPPLTISSHLRTGKLDYDPEKDFTYISLIGKMPLAISALNSFPAKTFKEFLAYVKARPGQINYGSAGTGSTNHVIGELLKLEAGINITHVPFKGGAPAMNALLANEIELYIATIPTIMPMVQAGRIRAIVVSSAQRAPSLPAVPTIAESGFPGFDLTSWFCVVGPARMPRSIVDRLNADIRKILNNPEFTKPLIVAGVNIEPTTPEQLGAFIRSETQKWGKAVKASGAKVE